MKDFVSEIASFFSEEGIGTDGVFHLAFSGGSDSLSLLHALTQIITGPLDAVYVDHALRERSVLDEEIALNRRNCKKLNVPFSVFRIPDGEIERLVREKGLTTEAAARLLRYRHFDSLDGYVITAHNQDDQAESVFMRLLTGSTFQSLAGIRKVRGKYLRPIISLTKSEIEDYARSNGLIWSYDHTNSELFCLRNRVRHLVMPYLSSDVKKSLVNIASNVDAFTSSLGMCSHVRKGIYVSLSRSELLFASELKRSITLLSLISCHTDRRISRGELDGIISSVMTGKDISGREYIVTVAGDEVRIYPQKYYFSARFTEDFHSGPFTAIRSDSVTALSLPSDGSLIIRMDESGDTLRTKGGSVKVSKLLSAMGVPYAPVVTLKGHPVAVFASSVGGVNRISADMLSSDWLSVPRFDVISSPLT